MFSFFIKLGVFLLELLYPSGGVDQFLFAGKIGMAARADFNGEILGQCRQGVNLVSTGTGNDDVMHFGMNALFHRGAWLS